jgi:hypothetical protein
VCECRGGQEIQLAWDLNQMAVVTVPRPASARRLSLVVTSTGAETLPLSFAQRATAPMVKRPLTQIAYPLVDARTALAAVLGVPADEIVVRDATKIAINGPIA